MYLRFIHSSSVPVHLPPFRPSHSPINFYNDCKGSEADGSHKGNQTSPIPRRLAYQGRVSGGGTSEHSDHGGPYTAFRVGNQSRNPSSRFSSCKTHTGQMTQSSGFDPTYFDCKMFDVANWVTRLNGEVGA